MVDYNFKNQTVITVRFDGELSELEAMLPEYKYVNKNEKSFTFFYSPAFPKEKLFELIQTIEKEGIPEYIISQRTK